MEKVVISVIWHMPRRGIENVLLQPVQEKEEEKMEARILDACAA